MPALVRYFQRRVECDDAPDLLGETLLVVWRRVDDLPDDPERARMWLFGVARGVLLNYFRGERRRLALVDRIRSGIEVDPFAAPADRGSDVRDAVDRLPGDLGELVRLVHWDGFTVVEAGGVLKIPESTARSWYRRARQLLRTSLEVDSSEERSAEGSSTRH